jgi:transcriptional regulator with XRE-family HTH domain
MTEHEETASDDQLQLAKRLRDAREYVGLSQEFVSEHLQIPRASISAMETGRRKVSGLELRRLAALYKVTVASLLGELVPDEESETARALFRAAAALSSDDREQVLRFAQFLKQAGKAPQSEPPRKEPKGRD